MNNKHWIFLFLAGSLLVLPITSHYAMSWQDLKEKATTLINNDMVRAIMALGLVAGGLYYYYFRKGSDDSGKGGGNLIPEGLMPPTLDQFQVYDQFNFDGGGAASCGYHTLLRGMQVVASKNIDQNETQLKKDLMETDLIAYYFGENGRWRNAIITKRRNNEDDGDWLDDGELEYLWKNYKTDILSEQVECGFLAIPNFKILGTEHSLLEPYIRDEVRPFLNQRKKMFHIFALGTMEQLTGTIGTRGHWYPLVMYQNEEGKRHYYIMDSGSWGATNRLKDVNAWKIINLIEQ